MTTDEFLEAMAYAAHECWADWMKYMRSRGGYRDGCPDFHYAMEWQKRWDRQMNLPYHQLREDEQQSDRDVVAKYYLPIISKYVASLRQELPAAEEMRLAIAFELREADRKTIEMLSATRRFRGVPRLVDCPDCGGTGFLPLPEENEFGSTICERCEGFRRVLAS